MFLERSVTLSRNGHINSFAPGVRTAPKCCSPANTAHRIDVDVLRKRKLYPRSKKLGIERCGFCAFCHGSETLATVIAGLRASEIAQDPEAKYDAGDAKEPQISRTYSVAESSGSCSLPD